MSVSSKRKKDLIFTDMQISQSLSFSEFKLFALIPLITFPKYFFQFWNSSSVKINIFIICLWGCAPLLTWNNSHFTSDTPSHGSGTWHCQQSQRQLSLGTAPSLPCCSQSTLHPLTLMLAALNKWMNLFITCHQIPILAAEGHESFIARTPVQNVLLNAQDVRGGNSQQKAFWRNVWALQRVMVWSAVKAWITRHLMLQDEY